MKVVIFKAKRMKLAFKPGPILLGIFRLQKLRDARMKKLIDKSWKEGMERVERFLKGEE